MTGGPVLAALLSISALTLALPTRTLPKFATVGVAGEIDRLRRDAGNVLLSCTGSAWLVPLELRDRSRRRRDLGTRGIAEIGGKLNERQYCSSEPGDRDS